MPCERRSHDRSIDGALSSSSRRRCRTRRVTAVVDDGFGPRALGREESWLSICTVRQNVWEHAVGQLTQVARECIEWFYTRTGTNVREIGAQLYLKDGTQLRVFLELGVIAGV